MSAVILNLFGRITAQPTPAQIIREDVKAALVGFSATRIAQAQARAERHLRNGYPIDTCIDRAVKWARCATDPSDPTPPRAA